VWDDEKKVWTNPPDAIDWDTMKTQLAAEALAEFGLIGGAETPALDPETLVPAPTLPDLPPEEAIPAE
jgi:hypothetical protein